ncbi:MAG: T9SS type A sorting domain-containing protein [Bacteroidales bacterium]|nr:T9SS type A sorting domain-containing protein [Bacteroidales bacterium]
MLKKMLLSVLLVLFYLISNAQNSISGENVLPQIGDELTMVYLDTVDIDINGYGTENHLFWDFSEISVIDTIVPTTIIFSDPTGSEYIDLYPDANILITYSDKPDSLYAIVSETSFSIKGQYSDQFYVNYENDSLLQYLFPLTSGDYYTSYNSANGMMNETELYLNDGIVEIFVDGFGTLKTPNGSVFNNVFRVKTIYSCNPSINLFGQQTSIPSVYTETYGWFNEDFTAEIMKYEISENSMNVGNKKVFYYQELIYQDNNEIVNIDTNNEVQNIYVCEGTSEENAITLLSPSLTVSDSFYEEHTVNITWTITEYNANQTGVYNAIGIFELPDGLVQPATPITLEVFADITVSLPFFLEESIEICDGTEYLWHNLIIDSEGTYDVVYPASTGCDSTYVINVSVMPLPQEITLIKTPIDGIINASEMGQVSITSGQNEIKYWITCNGEIVSQEYIGNGSEIIFDEEFSVGTYAVWSQTEAGCLLFQASVSFIQYSETNSITVSVNYGESAVSFLSEEVLVTLYEQSIDEENIILVSELAQALLGTNGQVVFESLEIGDYYLGSSIINPELFNEIAPHVYFESALVYEDAVLIHLDAITNYFAEINHGEIASSEGSNTGGGSVGGNEGGKSLNPIANMIVILKNMNINEIIGMSLTNSEGVYSFNSIPNETNIEIFVTSIEHQNWIPYCILTGFEQQYDVNFIVNGDNVYPEGLTNVFSNQSLFFDFEVFPNPTLNYIELRFVPENSDIQIYDLTGRLVYKNKYRNESKILVSDFKSGIYIVVANSKDGQIGLQKFVKK